MSTSSLVSQAPAARLLNRVTISVASALALSLAFNTVSSAQTKDTSATSFEVRFTSGAFVPTGSQRSFLKDAQVSAAQISWVIRPSLAITGTFGWARSRDLGSAAKSKLDAFTTDLGVETRPARLAVGQAVSFSPFAGVGAGVRTYNYRKLNVGATNNLAGYAAVGGELGIKRVGLRLEVRDYVAGFKPLAGAGKSAQRNDLVMMAGVRFNRRSPAQD